MFKKIFPMLLPPSLLCVQQNRCFLISLQSFALFHIPFIAVLLVITVIFLQINIFVNSKNFQSSFLKISWLWKFKRYCHFPLLSLMFFLLIYKCVPDHYHQHSIFDIIFLAVCFNLQECFKLLTDVLLMVDNEHCQWKVYKQVLIFSCLVQVWNDLNIISLLVISGCVYYEVSNTPVCSISLGIFPCISQVTKDK